MTVNSIAANLSQTKSIPHDVRGSRRFYSKGRTTMKNKFIAFLSACACAGAVGAGVLNVDVKSYDFKKIVAKGTASAAGTVSLTLNNGTPVQETVAAGDEYELVAAASAGNVYKYTVTLGDDLKSGEITMGNGSGKLFGADASANPATVNGSWDTAPAIEDSKYKLLGSNSKFTVTDTTAGKIVYIDSDMEFIDGADELDETLEALGAFTLAQTNETGDAVFFWAGLTGGTTKWVELTAQGVSASTGTYVSRMEFDFNQTRAKVRYSVGASAGALTVLKDAQGNEWFDANSSATAVASVAYEGTGSLASFEGSSIKTAVASNGTTEYTTIGDALAANKNGSLTLLTNTKPVVGSTLSDNSWTIHGDYAFEPTAEVGYDYTYSKPNFSVTTYTTSVTVSGSNTIGYDFTNSAITVTISDAHIQAGTSVSATVTVKDAQGNQVGAAQTIQNITGVGAQVPVNIPVTAQGDYTYEVVVKKDSTEIASYTGSFTAGNQANWFNAYASHWTDGGTWSPTVASDAQKIALGGNEYMFTATTPSASDGIVRVDTVIEVDGAIDNEDLADIATENVQGMITIAETSATDATPVWKAYNGDPTAWLELSGVTPVVTAGTKYTVRAEFDYRNAEAKKVRYSVSTDDGVTFTVLTGTGYTDGWIGNTDAGATSLASTTAVGAGNLVSLKGDNIDYYLAEVNGVKYESLADALAAAKAGNYSVEMLWDATWTPTAVGQWAFTGKNLIVNAKSGWGVKKSGNTWLVADTEVAKVVGGSNYFFLDDAFGDVAADGTVQMLTNLVQGVDVEAKNGAAILDLNGCFVKFLSGKKLTPAGTGLTITNASDVIGGFNGTIDGAYVIAGGKWVTGDSTKLMTGYKLVPLATTETVDGVTYTHEAIWTTIVDPTKAKVVPVVIGGGDGQPAEPVVVDNDFVKNYIGENKKPDEIAAALNNPPATTGNGLPLIQSYVLGLTPTETTSKPVVQSVQNADASKVTLSLGNVTVNTAAGVPVKFVLKAAATPAMTEATAKGESTEPNFTVDVPTDSEKVQYYKIEAVIGK